MVTTFVGCSEDTAPTWSPDGTRLALVRMQNTSMGASGLVTGDIAVTTVTDPHVVILAGTARALSSLSWR